MNIDDKSFRDKIDKWIDANTENIKRDIINLINIKSVASRNKEGLPYGDGCAKVLDSVLNLSKDYGFKCVNHEYYCGTCELKGKENEKEIGIFTHMDVVPEGDKWTYEPYNAVVKDGYIIGRGSSDNKGPAIASLYAMKFLKENSIELSSNIKLFYGCSEEAGMPDIEYYLKHNKAPDFSLIPDALFSVCYAEKGILEITVSKDIKGGNLVDFNGGEVSNVVPSYAYVVIDDLNYNEALELFKESDGFEVVKLNNGIKIGAFGSSKHAAFPEGSINSIGKLSSALIKNNVLKGDAVDAIKFLANSLKDYNGVSIGIGYKDEVSGKLTHISGIAKYEDNKLYINYNIRYPISVNQDEMINRIKNTFNDAGFIICSLNNNPPSYISKDDPIIKILCDISKGVLKKDYEPYVMGGGTYARKLPRAVAYGMGIKDEKLPFSDGRGGAHQPDECYPIKNILNGIKIYILALIEIDKYL